MLKHQITKIAVVVWLGLFAIGANAALPPPQVIDQSTVEDWMVNIGNFLLTAGMILGVIVIVYSGIRWMMAGSDSKASGDAKNILMSGIWGVAIVLGVGLIIKTIAAIVTGSFFP